MFFDRFTLKRLDLEFALFLAGCLTLIMAIGLCGGLWLTELEQENAASIERHYIENQLQAFKDKITGDVLLEHREAIRASVIQERQRLSLNRLTVTYQGKSEEAFGERKVKSLISSKIDLKIGTDTVATISYEAGSKFGGVKGRVIIFILLLFLILIMLMSVFVSRWLQTRFFDPFRNLLSTCKEDNAVEKLLADTPTSLELAGLRDQLVGLVQDQIEKQKKISEFEKRRGLAEMAKQVAHDIRSPLAALNVLLMQTDQLPEGVRPLMRGAVGRIRDIANNLLASASDSAGSAPEVRGVYLISGTLESMASEKRVAFRNRPRVSLQIDYLGSGPYGQFAHVDIIEFRRVISNLINNAVESYGDEGGPVFLTQGVGANNTLVVQVVDEGCGIPAQILSQLGAPGVTYRKKNGNGLGISHAKKTIEAWGGKFSIESEEGKGTKVTLSLPRSKAPKWFLPELQFSGVETIVVLDDDEAIHQTWARLLSTHLKNPAIINFRLATDLEAWLANHRQDNFFALFDFELIGQKTNGLELIIKHSLQDRAVLVTGRHEEDRLVQECEAHLVKMVPKGMVESVPMAGETALCMN